VIIIYEGKREKSALTTKLQGEYIESHVVIAHSFIVDKIPGTEQMYSRGKSCFFSPLRSWMLPHVIFRKGRVSESYR